MLKIYISFITLIISTTLQTALGETTVVGPHLKVELLSEFETIPSTKPFSLGIRFIPEKNWHVYWRNPGDSGSAPKFLFRVDGEETKPDTIFWPLPERIKIGPLANYGYENEAIIVFTFAPLQTRGQAGSVELAAELEWLVCQEECIPGFGTLTQKVTVGEATFNSDARTLIEHARHDTPALIEGVVRHIRFEDPFYKLEVNPAFISEGIRGVEFFPFDPQAISHPADQVFSASPLPTLRLEGRNAPSSPTFSGVLTITDNDGVRHGYEVDLPVAVARGSNSTDDMGLLLAILFAFFGGVILNLMPCVLPILTLKILGLVEAGEGKALAHSLVYGAGILVSLWILAAFLLSFRAAGVALGWGFQLQSPIFVTCMALFIFALGLNLAGIFQIGTHVQSLAGNVKCGEHGTRNAFLQGVLAVALASPCVAPFMGIAIGYALTANAFTTILIFSALGIGLAAPYVLAASIPAVRKLFPRPGAWMEKLKQLLAFPLFGTALWLMWILSVERGSNAAMQLAIGFLFVAFAGWIFGSFAHCGQTRQKRWTATFLALCVLVIGIAVAWPPAELSSAQKKEIAQHQKENLNWIPFSDEALAAARARGEAIYLDFTATWCITCQVNKRVVFGSAAVNDEFLKRKITLMRADWTNYDPNITAALKRYGRAGVPLNVFYPVKGEPVILPSLLTPSIVLDVINTANLSTK